MMAALRTVNSENPLVNQICRVEIHAELPSFDMDKLMEIAGEDQHFLEGQTMIRHPMRNHQIFQVA